MLKRVFMTPFWWMLTLGIIASVVSVWALHFLLGRGYPMRWPVMLSFFYLPAIMLIEAVMYLTIRQRMAHSRDVWSHLLLFTGAYVFNFLVRALASVIMILHSPMMSYMRVVTYGQMYIFWGLIIAAHVFFARVLVKAFARPRTEEETLAGGNLLDDVLD